MDLRRPGKKYPPPAKKSSGKFYVMALLIVGVMIIFWYNLKEFQGTENKKIESARDYLPAPHLGKVYDKPFFSLSYVEKYEIPEWVAYRLTRDMMIKPNHPRDQEFNPDPAIETGSAHYHDYKQSGYTKGHLVPAADMSWDQKAMNSTFLMSNVAPMLEKFNSGIWLELENDVRDWAMKYKNIIVVAGPVFRDSLGTIGANNVLVPRYFYKAVFTLNKDKPEVIGFIFDQKNQNPGTLDQYVVSIDSIEKETGLDLFANMYGNWESEISIEKRKNIERGEWPFSQKWYEKRITNNE